MKTIAKHVSAGKLAVLLLDAGVGQAYAQVTQNIGIKSWANDVMSGYDNGSYVVNGTESDPFVGNINNLPGKTRMLLKFDISNISGTVTAADLDLTSFFRSGTNVVQVSSYNSNETSDTFTSADIGNGVSVQILSEFTSSLLFRHATEPAPRISRCLLPRHGAWQPARDDFP